MGIVFPPNLNLEQASSQSTAEFKAQKLKGKKFLDLTSGFGIDAYYLSKNFVEITLVEQNKELLEIVKHNWNVLCKKAAFINIKLEDFLNETKENFDVIYLDPARRKDSQKKFILEDLEPNVLEWMDEFFQRVETVLIKLSPLLDLKLVINQGESRPLRY